MKLASISRAIGLLTLASTAIVSFDVAAQAAESVRLRGTITSFEGSTLVIKTREGEDKTVVLPDGWAVSSVATASAADIKTGDYVGIASLPNADGSDGALEVLIFPAALKGAGEGSSVWDLQPGSTMTNATVANVVTSDDGHSVKVSYQGNEKTIDIPEVTPIVTFAPATKADLVPGAVVFIPSEVAADGTISAHTVVVGTKGVVPPM
ncbi:MAG: hypothetical protein JWP26_1724 [Devosia sp.]|uniref:hypothetical protein n=1 Tax=Devosia sp. TaxID=1871048 RepID=UPI002604A08B|nr:hypothetical protein [Devosia sp.]MDB5586754.1 hypothetical protein [Devosia sp.]